MNRLILVLLFLFTAPSLRAVPILPTDQVTLAGRTIYRDGNLAEPDSLRIQVFRNGTELHDQWYDSGDTPVTAVDGWLIFEDRFQDIDGAGGSGSYLLLVRAYDSDSSLFTPIIYNFEVGTKLSLENVLDSLSQILDTLKSQDDWVSSLNQSDRIGIDLDNTAGRLDSTELSENVINNSKLAPNSITESELYSSAGSEIGYYVWSSSSRKITGGAVDSNRTEGSLDSAGLAGVVWNTPQANHTIEGTFGDYLDSDISGIGTGAGLYSYTLTAFDSSTMQVVPGASFVIRNIDQSVLVASGNADMSGRRNFNLDSDSYLAVAFAPGYVFASPDTITISGAGFDTLYGYRFDPGTSSQPGLCRVYGFLYDIAGNPEKSAVVQARIPEGVTRTGAGIVSPYRVETESDSLGYFYLDLIPSPQLIPDTVHYEITITLEDGAVLLKRVIVPDLAEWLLTW